MNLELKQKWVAALRSGQYAQGRNRLRCGSWFCGLGVLCDVFDPNRWAGDGYTYRGHTYYSTLHSQFLLDVGMTREEADILTDLNDDEGKSFDEIADYVESNMSTAEADR